MRSDPPALGACTTGWTPGWTAGLLAPVVAAGCSIDASATTSRDQHRKQHYRRRLPVVAGADRLVHRLSLRSNQRYAHNYGAPKTNERSAKPPIRKPRSRIGSKMGINAHAPNENTAIQDT